MRTIYWQTGQYRMLQGGANQEPWKMQDRKMTDRVAGLESD